MNKTTKENVEVKIDVTPGTGDNINVEVIVKENPLLAKIRMPGQTFRLPSKGIFYKNEELDVGIKNGEVEVFPMTTIDEIHLKTPDMIFQGTAITKVFERCIPSIKKPLKLLSQDVDYLLGCLRQVSYGDILPIKQSCECTEHKEVNEYRVPLNKILINNTIELNEKNIDNEYTYALINEKNNNVQINIQFKPILFEKLVEMYQFRAESDMEFDNIDPKDKVAVEKMDKAIEEFITMTLASVIESIDGIDDVEQIREWCEKLPVALKDKLSDKLESQTDWGTKFEYTVKCFDCDKDLDVTASMNPVGFFMLPSRPTKQK